MSREDFDYGADVAAAGGVNYKNPTPGSHDSIITGIVHVGSFADLYVEGNKREVKPPCNFILVQTTLLGPEDVNEDGSPIQKWQSMPLKHGDKANLTKFMNAVDPAAKLKGMADVIGVPVLTTWKENEKKGKNEDGTWKAVNLTGYANATDRLAAMITADYEKLGLTPVGHVTFANITLEVLETIPGYLISQYLLSEKNGDNLSYAGSAVEAIIKAKREADPTWKVAKAGDEGSDDGKPGNEQRQGSTTGPSSVPEAANVEVPADLNANQEF